MLSDGIALEKTPQSNKSRLEPPLLSKQIPVAVLKSSGWIQVCIINRGTVLKKGEKRIVWSPKSGEVVMEFNIDV
jgi:hypothetical protein